MNGPFIIIIFVAVMTNIVMTVFVLEELDFIKKKLNDKDKK